MLKVNYNSLGEYEKVAFLSLLRFPENAVIKERNIILWWKHLTSVDDPEGMFWKLRERNLIVPHGHDKLPVQSKFKINPWVRHQSVLSFLQNEESQYSELQSHGIYSNLITSSRIFYLGKCLELDQPNVKLSNVSGLKSTHWQAVFNVGANYLNFGPQWMAKQKNLEVLQLGRWLHNSAKHHIEVQSEEFLKELRDQKHLKYLSLRGISRIFELPPSILQLESLETLDLKACHNLETLPNDITSLRNLKHLNLSKCYLLERMPKGIDKLTKLEVLKGFVIGNSSKTPCKISDIANLKKLKQLSIYIISGAVIQDREFESLKELEELRDLKISWGVSDTRYTDFFICFPSSLRKLHIEGFPGQNIAKWLKKSIKLLFMLRELNITGGKVSSIDHDEIFRWNLWLYIIRLKYLKYLNVDPTNLRDLIPSLRYAEIKQKMSIRTNPMKAVPTLLKRLVSVEKRADLEDLKSELIKIKNLFSIVKRNEDELLDTLTVVDGYLRNLNIPKLMEEKDDICHRIRISTQKLLPQSDYTQLPQSSKDVNVAVPSTPHFGDLEMLKVNYNSLGEYEKVAFLSLLRFPENAVIKKRNIFLWWKQSGLDYVREVEFRKLRECNLIVPHGHVKCPVESKFKINPWVRHQSLWSFLQNEERQLSELRRSHHPLNMCLQLYQPNFKISVVKTTQWRIVLNISASYLNFESQWMVKMKNLEVLQLGRWLHESAKHHIEVQSEEFLKELRDQKYLKYLSLRGISRIFELPSSILQLESLETLDLKACHNLETLPNDIASLRNLKYLNLSECYLLDRMPKGIDKLSELEVLKGFVIGSSIKTPCRISDIANLKKLKRLSIHITSGAVIQDREFESLKELKELENLKISWGVSDTKYIDFPIIFPSSLRKLHIEGFLGQNILKWLKKSFQILSMLEELNITGGKVSSIDHDKKSRRYLMLHIIRLKYLKYLNVDPTNLRDLFPWLRYAEIKQVQNLQYFEWSKWDEKS
ncbi:Disease resistance RPP13-like protein 4, partial [Mucuna pruriens]